MFNNEFTGKWHIISMDPWDQDYIDEVEPGYIEFGQDGLGSLHFGFIFADIDYRITNNTQRNVIEFSFAGKDEYNEICGRGTASKTSGQLIGNLFIHHGDDSAFIAKPFE